MQSLRVAIEGCGHGTLHAIYASVAKSCKQRKWDSVDLLIIGGDFQAVRNASDLNVLACPAKYRSIGDFYSYYNGDLKAPYLTIFVGGNHEASNHLWELFYGGWVAPNIYYMGAANVVRLGGVRIAGISGIWKGYNFRKPHYERLPYNEDDVRSIYHVREIETRKLLQIRSKVDVGISHDWPKTIELYGDTKALFRNKPDFQQESRDGTFGNEAARLIMDRLRPPYWFSAHMHCRYSAIKTYDKLSSKASDGIPPSSSSNPPTDPKVPINEDEIDLDLEQVESEDASISTNIPKNSDEIDLESDMSGNDSARPVDASSKDLETKIIDQQLSDKEMKSSVTPSIRAQLPAAFSRHQQSQPSCLPPTEITNTTVRFLSLDKCLPGRKFLQLLTIGSQTTPKLKTSKQKPVLEYDPEWLAITRVFDSALAFGDRNAQIPPDLGEAQYLPMIQKEREWIDEHVVKAGKLEIPENFEITAPPYVHGTPEIIKEGPFEYNNPQTQQFCDLIGIQNKLFATEEERANRMLMGPFPVQEHNRDESKSGHRRGGRFGGKRGFSGKNGRNFRGNRGRKK